MPALELAFAFEEIPQPPDEAQARRERVKAILRRYRAILTPEAEAPTLDVSTPSGRKPIPQEGRRD